MSAVGSSPQMHSTPPMSFDFKSLAEDPLHTISDLKSNKFLIPEFLQTVIEEQNAPALDELMESKLASFKEIEENTADSEWFLEYYADALFRAVEQKKDKLLNYLVELQRPLKQVFLEKPKLLGKGVLERLLRSKKVPRGLEKSLLENADLQPILREILEEAILNISLRQTAGKSSVMFEKPLFSFFKDSPFLEKFVQNTLEERRTEVLKKLIDVWLIGPNLLQLALSKDIQLHSLLLEEFKAECKKRESNEGLILFLIDAGLKFESLEIYPIAKSGNCSLLRKISDRGYDISEAVFRLMKEGGSLLALLKEGAGKGIDPNLKSQEGNTLLVEAVLQNKHYIIQDLLRCGANPLILDSQGHTVFEISKGKSLETRRALYAYPELRGSLLIGSRNDLRPQKIEEEEILTTFLDRHAQGKPFAKFFALFIKVRDFALVLLKPKNLYPETPRSYQEVFARHPENRIYCWSSSHTYGIPEKFAPNHLSMYTLGFVIKEASKEDGEESCVIIKRRRYACIGLESEYKTKNPDIDQGFKYSYKGVHTHGHGKNPEALRAAFRQHRDGIRLNWITIPDLSENQEELATFGEQINAMFDVEQENAGKLAELQDKVSSYIEQSESIIEARRSVSSSSGKAGEERRLVESAYDSDIKERLRNAHTCTFSEKRLLEWQGVIRKQIQSLQELERKLLTANSMDTAVFEQERKGVDGHLKSIRDMIGHRSVTSSEVPTLKVYMSFPLIKDIFAPEKASTDSIKKTICRLIGTFLHRIPPSIDQTLAECFLDGEFRQQMIGQLHQESQFIVTCTHLGTARDHALSIKMQKLAIELALIRDTSAMLEQIPPVSLTSDVRRFSSSDEILEGTMLKHLQSYASARGLLDELWLKTCHDPEVLENHTDEMLRLFMQRLLLMDEEIREVIDASLYYPNIESRSPRGMLDEQLFLLTSSLLISLSYQQEKQPTPPWHQHVMEYLHLRLTPSFHGVEKKRYKPDGLFLSSLIDVIPQIKDIVDAAWESDKSESSPFQRLNILLEDYYLPKKEELEAELRRAFRKLSPDDPYLQFDPLIETLVSKIREIRSEIEKYVHSDKQNDLGDLIKEGRYHFEKALKVFDYLDFGTIPSEMTMQKVWEIVEHQSFSSSDKDRLKEARIEDFKSNIRSSVQVLLQKTKGSFSSQQLPIDKMKILQRECGGLLQRVDEYLRSEKHFRPLEIAQLRQESLAILTEIKALSKGSLEKSINKLSIVYDNLNKGNSEGIDAVLEVQNLSEQLEKFFKGKKGKKIAEQYGTLPQKLSASVKPHIEATLPIVFKQLCISLQRIQEEIYSMYFKRLEKMQNQLRLGIREQTYYTTDQTHVSYYLWDGKPFDALPYHTDNEVHLPLEDNYALRQSRQERLLRSSFKDPYSEDEDRKELHVTSIRDFGRQSKRRKLSINKREGWKLL